MNVQPSILAKLWEWDSVVVGGGAGAPANGYVAEDGTTFYVAEDGATFYVQEA